MSEYIPIIIGALSPLLGGLGAYVIIKKYINRDFLMSELENIIDEIANNKEFQQKIYMAGAILGQGVKGGLGLPGAGRGKFKIEDIVGMAIQQFLPKVFNNLGGEPGQGQAAPVQPQETSTVVSPYG